VIGHIDEKVRRDVHRCGERLHGFVRDVAQEPQECPGRTRFARTSDTGVRFDHGGEEHVQIFGQLRMRSRQSMNRARILAGRPHVLDLELALEEEPGFCRLERWVVRRYGHNDWSVAEFEKAQIDVALILPVERVVEHRSGGVLPSIDGETAHAEPASQRVRILWVGARDRRGILAEEIEADRADLVVRDLVHRPLDERFEPLEVIGLDASTPGDRSRRLWRGTFIDHVLRRMRVRE